MLSFIRSIFLASFVLMSSLSSVAQAQAPNPSSESRADAEQLLLKAVKKVGREGKNAFPAINNSKG